MIDCRRCLVIGLAATLLLTGQAHAQEQEAWDRIPPADPADVESIDAIIAAIYDVISGPAGQRDWERMRSLFAPGGRLIPVSRDQQGRVGMNALNIDGYIARTDPYFQQNAFFERELSRRTERFGHVAHAFSTYASYHSAEDEEPFSRGINSFQLMFDGERWWIVSVFWQAESPDNPIPEQYLP